MTVAERQKAAGGKRAMSSSSVSGTSFLEPHLNACLVSIDVMSCCGFHGRIPSSEVQEALI